MLVAGPEHPITITKHPKTVRVTFNGQIVAESANALRLQEASYPAVFCIPPDDVRREHFRASTHTSRCPHKGAMTYFSLDVDGKTSENAVWCYAAPFPVVAQLKDYVAFYPDRIDAIAEF